MTTAKYSGDVLSLLPGGNISRGTGSTPLIRGFAGACGWRIRGTSMNLGDSGGIT